MDERVVSRPIRLLHLKFIACLCATLLMLGSGSSLAQRHALELDFATSGQDMAAEMQDLFWRPPSELTLTLNTPQDAPLQLSFQSYRPFKKESRTLLDGRALNDAELGAPKEYFRGQVEGASGSFAFMAVDADGEASVFVESDTQQFSGKVNQGVVSVQKQSRVASMQPSGDWLENDALEPPEFQPPDPPTGQAPAARSARSSASSQTISMGVAAGWHGPFIITVPAGQDYVGIINRGPGEAYVELSADPNFSDTSACDWSGCFINNPQAGDYYVRAFKYDSSMGAEDLPAEASYGFGTALTDTTSPDDLYGANIAVELDDAMFQLLGSSVQAVNDYLAQLFAYNNLTFEEEIKTRLLISDVFLYTSDPYSNTGDAGVRLSEVRSYWANNGGDVDRALLMHLSPSVSGGVAYLETLCNSGWGYSVSGVYGTAPTDELNINWDGLVTAHELGHNFGSGHTHCYAGLEGNSSPIDGCYVDTSNTNACYQGNVALPGLGALTGGSPGAQNGTIMGYCHLREGGISNVARTFGLNHPYGVEADRVPTLMARGTAQVAAAASQCLSVIPGGGSGDGGSGSNLSTVNILAGTGGTASVSGEQFVPAGESLSFTIYPNVGYEVGIITGSCPLGQLVGDVYTVETFSSAECSITVNFNTVDFDSAMRISDVGQGEVLLFPYFSAAEGADTEFSIENATDQVKAVRMTFREGVRGAVVLSFNTYLRPQSTFSAAITQREYGDGAEIVTVDDTCTVPTLGTPNGAYSGVTTTNPDGSVTKSQPFHSYDYSGGWSFEDSFSGDERTLAGYFEVVEMGQWDPLSGLGLDAAELNCGNLMSAWSSGGEWLSDPTAEALSWQGGGLSGSGSVTRISYDFQGTARREELLVYDAIALDKFARRELPGEYHASPGVSEDGEYPSPGLRSARRSIVQSLNGVERFQAAASGLDAVSALLMKTQVNVEPPEGMLSTSAESWLVSMPTKVHHTSSNQPVPPFISTWDPQSSQACEEIELGDAVTSPPLPILQETRTATACSAVSILQKAPSSSAPLLAPDWLEVPLIGASTVPDAARFARSDRTAATDDRRISITTDDSSEVELVGLPAIVMPVYRYDTPNLAQMGGVTPINEAVVNGLEVTKDQEQWTGSSVSVYFNQSNETGFGIDRVNLFCRNVTTGGVISEEGGQGSWPMVSLNIPEPSADYECQLYAENALGKSEPDRFQLEAPIPPRPTISSATAEDGEIRLVIGGYGSGSDILEYEVSCTDGRTTAVGGSFNGPVVIVSGLTNGVAYQCQARARNSAGWSDSTAYPESLTPEEFVPAGLPVWLLYLATQSGGTESGGSGGGSSAACVDSATINCSSAVFGTESSTQELSIPPGKTVAARFTMALSDGVMAYSPTAFPDPPNGAVTHVWISDAPGGTAFKGMPLSGDNTCAWKGSQVRLNVSANQEYGCGPLSGADYFMNFASCLSLASDLTCSEPGAIPADAETRVEVQSRWR